MLLNPAYAKRLASQPVRKLMFTSLRSLKYSIKNYKQIQNLLHENLR